ncbi:hypothetical protein ABZ746_15765 [Streptomyces sp. NPDC020096]
MFAPGYAKGKAPFGQWMVNKFWVDRRWAISQTQAGDVAFATLHHLNGRHAQDVVGYNAVAMEPGKGGNYAGRNVQVWGYPGRPPYDGEDPQYCRDHTRANWSNSMYEVNCAMNEGASGGPWLDADNAAHATVIGVTSSTPTTQAGKVVQGAQFTSEYTLDVFLKTSQSRDEL